MTLLEVPSLLKSVIISRYLLTVTLLAGLEGVTVSGDVCIDFDLVVGGYELPDPDAAGSRGVGWIFR